MIFDYYRFRKHLRKKLQAIHQKFCSHKNTYEVSGWSGGKLHCKSCHIMLKVLWVPEVVVPTEYKEFYPSGKLRSVSLRINGKFHSGSFAPAFVSYYESGAISSEQYLRNGLLSRIVDGPAVVRYHENGQVKFRQYWCDGFEHNNNNRNLSLNDNCLSLAPTLEVFNEQGLLIRRQVRLHGKLVQDERFNE